eukprot:scaffold77830_cov36-Phaeocystis_antarctica.AAC.1
MTIRSVPSQPPIALSSPFTAAASTPPTASWLSTSPSTASSTGRHTAAPPRTFSPLAPCAPLPAFMSHGGRCCAGRSRQRRARSARTTRSRRGAEVVTEVATEVATE